MQVIKDVFRRHSLILRSCYYSRIIPVNKFSFGTMDKNKSKSYPQTTEFKSKQSKKPYDAKDKPVESSRYSDSGEHPDAKQRYQHSDSTFSSESLKKSIVNLKSLLSHQKKGLISKLKNISFETYDLSLKELKNLFLEIDANWIGEDDIKNALLHVNSEFDSLLSKVSDIYDLERLVSLYYFGRIFMDDAQKEKVITLLSNFLQKESQFQFYTATKILNNLSYSCEFNSQEFDELLTSILNMKDKSLESDVPPARPYLFLLNAILMENNIDSPNLQPILRKLIDNSPEDFSTRNVMIFNLENLRVLAEGNDAILREISEGLSKISDHKFKRSVIGDSNTQKKIANILLDLMFLTHQEQDIGVYSVDFLLKPKLILEYHGYSHYYVNKLEIIKFHKLKIRVLEKMGYHVQIIPYYEWHPLESRIKQEEYLKEIIYRPFVVNK